MDTIFSSCKRGDLSRVKYFVEKKEVDLNARDSWDSTCLYYACLCGHFKIVQYLLENGAHCEEGSRDGERCLYGSLTDEIREFLLNSKVISAQCKRRDEYQDYCERLWRSDDLADFRFTLGNCRFKVHRIILCARSEFFRDKFQNEWQDHTSAAVNFIGPNVFEALLQYLYTGRAICPKDQIDELIRVAAHCRLSNFKFELETSLRAATAFEGSKNVLVKVSKIIAESEKLVLEVQQDFGFLISFGLPLQYCLWTPSIELPVPSPYFDLCFCADGKRFYCHKVFVSTRSAYFNCLLKDHFHESRSDENNITIITLQEIAGNTLASILYFVYTNNAEFITENTVYDLLNRADLYLLPGLKRSCGNFLTSTATLGNIVSILKVSRFYDLPKLEDFCTNFMAKEIESLVDDIEFQELIISDANEVQNRQDTDSIPVIDDVRHHITMCVQTFSQVEVANKKLSLIDNLLTKLHLDA